MKGFAIKDCKSEYVIDIKNQYKKFANKQEVRNAYTKLLNETNIALDNIKEILDNQEECEKLLSSLRQCDTSFLDSVIGTFEHGQNGSHYRAYLALDEKSVVEIRIANHYETKGVILDKSNNKSQYLYQIVLVTNPPIQQSDDSIRGSANVANVKVLTKGLIGDNATDDDIKKLLTSIYDYLIQPNNSFDNAIYGQETNENKIMNKKQVIRLNENQLKQIVTESVKRVLKETAGHLYYKDDEGNPHTNSKELYRGVKGAIFVYHGDWADPEILYKNHSINYWDAEQSLWYSYKEYCEENNIKPTDDGFEKYVNEYEDVASTLDDLVWALDGNP